jgi:hypothetical protein
VWRKGAAWEGTEAETGRTRGGPIPFDVDRLNPEERKLWDEHFASGADSLAIRAWSFGYWCMLDLGQVPEVVTEYLDEVDFDNLVLLYLNNVRRERRE